MPDPRVEIAWWPSTRIQELQSFIDSEWKAGHILSTDEVLLRWQHPRSDDEISVVGATEDGHLVGILGVIPVEICLRGDRVPGGWLTTWIVTPPARRRRVGLRLLEFVLERHEFVGTIGANATTMKILGALRFHTGSAVPRWVRPIREDALERLVGAGFELPAPAAGGGHTPVTHATPVRDWSPELGTQWDDVWSRQIAPEIVGTWRDAAYLDWRYVSHPRYRYRIRVGEDRHGRPSALLVHRTESVQGADANVLRVVEAIGDAAALTRLVHDLAEIGHEEEAAFADFYCTGERYGRALEDGGFVPEGSLPVSLPSRFQPLEPGSRPLTAALRLMSRTNGDDLFAGDDVYFTRSDCDQDRPS